MYHQFNIQQFYALPKQCISVFCMGLRTNADYFPIEHKLNVVICFAIILYEHKTNDYIRRELRITGILDKIDEYRRN